MGIGERIKTARLSMPGGPSQSRFGKFLKPPVSRDVVKHWETERTSLEPARVKEIAKLTGLPESWFYEDGPILPLDPGNQAQIQVREKIAEYGDVGRPFIPVSYAPLLIRYAGVVPAGNGWGDPLASEEFREVDARFVKNNRFMCRVAGDSCEPALYTNDWAIFEADPSPEFGVIVLAQEPEDHGCTVKVLGWDKAEKQSILAPINPTATIPPMTNGFIVVARLVGVIRKHGRTERTWYVPEGITGADMMDRIGPTT